MRNVKEVLNSYKRLEITKSQINEALGDNFQLAADSEPVSVDSQDLIFVLQAVKKGNLSVPDLVDWVNIIWFSELYDYADKHTVILWPAS